MNMAHKKELLELVLARNNLASKNWLAFLNNFLAYFLRHTLHVLLQSVADQLNYCSRLGNIFEVFLHFCSTYVYTNFPSLFFRQNLIRVLNATDALTQPVVAAAAGGPHARRYARIGVLTSDQSRSIWVAKSTKKYLPSMCTNSDEVITTKCVSIDTKYR